MTIDLVDSQTRICRDLPAQSTWLYHNEEQTEWDFKRARHGIPSVTDDSLQNLDLKAEWKILNVFGHADTNTIWYFHLCIHSENGKVYVLDSEKDASLGEKDLFPISSTLDCFIEVFTTIDQYLRYGIPPPKNLLHHFHEIEPDNALANWWSEWVSHFMY